MKTIVVIVTTEGETRVETRGFAGQACQTASRFLEEALGKRLTERLTAEFHTAQQANERTRTRH